MINSRLLDVQDGLAKPYVSAASTYSAISGLAVMTHRVFPGLAAFIEFKNENMVFCYTDTMPLANTVDAVLLGIERESQAQPGRKHWLIQLESGARAWQFISDIEEISCLSPYMVFCEWKPGALNEALELHDDYIGKLWDDDDLLIGSELERRAYAQFGLSAGYTSVFHPLIGIGAIDLAMKNKGKSIEVNRGGCLKMRAIRINWHLIHESS